MFDIGFWELAIIAVVALVVIGPERLPGVARTVGKWVGRAQRFIGQVRDDIDREIRQDELKKALENEAGLDEIKEIMNTDQFVLEEEEKPDYQVKAINDDEVSSNDSGHGEYDPLPQNADSEDLPPEIPPENPLGLDETQSTPEKRANSDADKIDDAAK